MENSNNNYPKITHLSPVRRHGFKVNPKDPNFDKPLSELNKTYEDPYTRKVRRHEDYGDFEIIELS